MQIVVGHANPDFDAYASTVAATKLFPGAKGVFLGSQNANVRAFHNLHEEFFDFVDLKGLAFETVDRVVMVDTRDPDRVGELGDVVRRPGVEVIVYDHHPRQEGDIDGADDRSVAVGATTSILAHGAAPEGDRDHPARGQRDAARHPRGHRFAHVPGGHRVRRGGGGVAHGQRRRPRGGEPVPCQDARARAARAPVPADRLARDVGRQRAADRRRASPRRTSTSTRPACSRTTSSRTWDIGWRSRSCACPTAYRWSRAVGSPRSTSAQRWPGSAGEATTRQRRRASGTCPFRTSLRACGRRSRRRFRRRCGPRT